MSVRDDYFKYLRHFGATIPVSELHRDAARRDAVALRHDVDYDLDFALELAFHEHERGFRSSYYLLHTAPYWGDPRLIEKALQLQDFGHEVGLHVNLATQWVTGAIDDPAACLRELLEPLRAAGLRVTGIAAHGDRLCYERGFSNAWLFAELRPDDPAAHEDGRTAEGPVAQDPSFALRYPASHRLARDGDAELPLWSVRMAELGLEYHAYHVPHDAYFTDSGGGWQRSANPLTRNVASGRVQVLMHPIYYRGPQKLYLFLSAARSGSKWLANYLDQATNLTARHEFALNHRYEEGELIADKRTAEGFTSLVADREEARRLLLQARMYLESQTGDQAEVNVYLERFADLIAEVFPDAALIHLHRDPRQVVRSILNRDWYDTPDDTRHPVMNVKNWDRLSQYEKACWYVRETTQTLLGLTDRRIELERATSEADYLPRKLREWGIAVYPRLAEAERLKRINANRRADVPTAEKWPEELVKAYDAILGAAGHAQRRGVGWADRAINGLRDLAERCERTPSGPDRLAEAWAWWLGRPPRAEVIAAADFRAEAVAGVVVAEGELKPSKSGLRVTPHGERHAHVLLGGGAWGRLGGRGWPSQIGHYYRVRIETLVEGETQYLPVLMCLSYDGNGSLLDKRQLARLRAGETTAEASFRPRSDAARFNLVIFLSQAGTPRILELRSLRLEKLPLQAANAGRG